MPDIELDLGPKTVNITRIWRGDRRAVTFTVTVPDPDNEDERVPLDLTDYTASGAFRATKDADPDDVDNLVTELTMTFPDREGGKVRAQIDCPADAPPRVYWDVEVTPPGGGPLTIVEGYVKVRGQRTLPDE